MAASLFRPGMGTRLFSLRSRGCQQLHRVPDLQAIPLSGGTLHGRHRHPGVNFINILLAALMRLGPKSAKRHL